MGLFTHDILDSPRTDVQPPGFFHSAKNLESSWELWKNLQKRTGYLIINLGMVWGGGDEENEYIQCRLFKKMTKLFICIFFRGVAKKYGQVIWNTLHLTTPQIVVQNNVRNTCVCVCLPRGVFQSRQIMQNMLAFTIRTANCTVW